MSSLYSILKSLDRASTRSHSKSNIWEITVRHDELNKYRLIRGNDKYVVEQKASEQLAIWNEMWQRKLEKEQKIFEKEQKTKYMEIWKIIPATPNASSPAGSGLQPEP